MKHQAKAFYSSPSQCFIDAQGQICQMPSPLSQIAIILPTNALLIAHVSDSPDEDRLYMEAIEQLGLGIEGDEEYYFLAKIKNLVYLYPSSIIHAHCASLQQEFIKSPFIAPLLFCYLPFLRTLAQKSPTQGSLLFIMLEESQRFCCILHHNELHFFKAFEGCDEVSCETHIIQELAYFYPIWNHNNITPRSIFAYMPLLAHQAPLIQEFCHEHFGSSVEYLTNLPSPFSSSSLALISESTHHFSAQSPHPPLKHIRQLALSLFALIIALLFMPTLELLNAYTSLYKKDSTENIKDTAKEFQQSDIFLQQSIQKDYFPIEQLSEQELYQAQYINYLNAFYTKHIYASQALFVFMRHLPAQTIFLQELELAYQAPWYYISCKVRAREYQPILDFLVLLKQTQAYQKIFMAQSVFEDGYHQAHINIIP